MEQRPQRRGRALLLEQPAEVLAAIAAQLDKAVDCAHFACTSKATAEAAAAFPAQWWGTAAKLRLVASSAQSRLDSLRDWLARRRPFIHTLSVSLPFDGELDFALRKEW